MIDVISKIFEAYQDEGWSSESSDFENDIQIKVRDSMNSELSDFFEFFNAYDKSECIEKFSKLNNLKSNTPEFWFNFTGGIDFSYIGQSVLYVDKIYNSMTLGRYGQSYIMYPLHESLINLYSPDGTGILNDLAYILMRSKILTDSIPALKEDFPKVGFKLSADFKKEFFNLKKKNVFMQMAKYPLYILSDDIVCSEDKDQSLPDRDYQELWDEYEQIYLEVIKIKSLLFIVWPKLAVYWDYNVLRAKPFNIQTDEFKNLSDIPYESDYWNVMYYPTLEVKKLLGII